LPYTIEGWEECQWNEVGMTRVENGVKCFTPNHCFPDKLPEDIGVLKKPVKVIGHLKSAKHAEKHK